MILGSKYVVHNYSTHQVKAILIENQMYEYLKNRKLRVCYIIRDLTELTRQIPTHVGSANKERNVIKARLRYVYIHVCLIYIRISYKVCTVCKIIVSAKQRRGDTAG